MINKVEISHRKLSMGVLLSAAVCLISPAFALTAVAQEAPDVDAAPDMQEMADDGAPDLLAMGGHRFGPGPGGPGGFGGPGGPGGFKHHRFGKGGCPMFASCLTGANALTDDQLEKLHALKNDFLDQAGPKMVEMFRLHRQMQDGLTSANIDSKSVNDAKAKMVQTKADLENLKLDSKIKAMNVLTAEQRKELRTNMLKGGPRFGRMHMMKGQDK